MDAHDDQALLQAARALGDRLSARGEQVATAESCTGGWVAKVLTDVAGSSEWFGFGIVSYANAAKKAVLDVPESLLAQHGAVSREAVEAMAAGVLRLSGAGHALAISGVAGPGGGSADKPPGTVWFAWAHAGSAAGSGGPFEISTECHHFAGDREAVRRAAVGHALAGLLERLDEPLRR